MDEGLGGGAEGLVVGSEVGYCWLVGGEVA